MNQARILIASLLHPVGVTGVQTHSRVFRDFATDSRLAAVELITPYGVSKPVRGALRRIAKLMALFDQEQGILTRRYFSYLLLYSQLLRRIKTADSRVIVYAQDPLSASAALAAKRNNRPIEVVLAIHFNLSESWEAMHKGIARRNGRVCQNLDALEERVVPSVDRLVFVSEFMKAAVLKRIHDCSTVPSWVIPNAAKVPEPPASDGPNADLITIGTIEPRKNQAFLIRVLSEAHRLGRPYTLTVVGEGELKPQLLKLVDELGLQQHVEFTGWLPDAARWIHHHRLYVHASIMESFGTVIVEALACGKPVFAAPVGGIPEIFQDGVEGFYWNLDDPTAGARQIVRVLENGDCYKRLSAAARQRYEREFSTGAIGSKLLDAILGRGISEGTVSTAVRYASEFSSTR